MATLNKHLKERVMTFESGMTFIHHPLVVTTFFGHDMEIEHSNKLYEHKLGQLEIAEKKKDIDKYVFTHERAYRFDALHDIATNIDYWNVTKEAYWKLVADVWVDQESIYENKEEWGDILNHPKFSHNSHLMMDDDEMKEFDNLPNEFEIYRGGIDAYAFSWTLDKKKAEWFANRFGAKNKVFTKTIKKEDAMALFNARGEKEILYNFLNE